MQFWLNELATFYTDLSSVTVDGSYGASTAAAVRAFQSKFGLGVDGVVGQTTWQAIYSQYQSLQSDISSPTPNTYPGTPLRQGDSGLNVKLVQFWLKIAHSTYTSLPDVSVDGTFGAATRSAVVAFQTYFGLSADGVVGETTWNKLHEVYNGIANDLLDSALRPGDFPGTLRLGSSGVAVRELQYYLYLVSAYESTVPTVTIDGTFGTATQSAVRAFQTLAGLTVDGVVGQATWTALYNMASKLRLSGPVLTITRRDYPGTPLTIGSEGDDVLYYSTLIDRIAYYFDSVQSAGQTAVYNEALATATRSFQQLEGLPVTGTVNAETWAAAEALSLTLLANAEPKDPISTTAEYPGFATAMGSAGAHVKLIQQWINSIGTLNHDKDYVDEDGTYGDEEAARIATLQAENGLSPNGVVDKDTWYVLRAAAKEG